MEKEATTIKRLKSALAYPIVVSVLAVVVIAVLVTFVLPAFTSLYSSLNAKLPLPTRMLLAIVDGLSHYGLYILIALLVGVGLAFIYIKTPAGRYQWDKLALRLPLVGRVNLLNELARCCRSMSLLFRAGLPLPEIMSLIIQASGNKIVTEALTGVQQGMLQGEGLSQPMAKNRLFLPMMVQMVRVGEETGNLDVTLLAVAENYEIEASEKTRALIAIIQPALTLIIGLTVAFVAMSMVSAMYSVYGQMA
jgi:type IV pilus assembly protein PilC